MFGLAWTSLLKALSAIFCIVSISWLVLDYFVPAPQSKITIATSFTGGHYQALGRRYQAILARSHIDVEARATDGAVENLRLLNDPDSGVQIGIMQGGVSNGRLSPDLLSLGRIDYQIFWLFHRATETFVDVRQLKGKRIALGPPGSGTRAVSEKILNIAGIYYDNTTLLTLAAQGAVNALNDGKIDALFLTFAPNSSILISLLKNPIFKPMSFAEADALTRIYPFLVKLVLPRATIDFEKTIPAADVTIIATTNVVLVRKEIHPALIDLLAQTILETHNESGLFQRVGDFPTQIDPEFPMAQSALDFYKNGPSFLNRYLPFWMTSYAQRTIAVLVAVVAVILPIFNYLPRLYRWFVRERILRLYHRLRIVERGLQTELTVSEIVGLQGDLEKIDRAVTILGVPTRFSDLFFSLKVHINLIRTRLAARLAEVRSTMARVA